MLDGFGERGDLLIVQVEVLRARRLWKLQSGRGIGRHAAVLDRWALVQEDDGDTVVANLDTRARRVILPLPAGDRVVGHPPSSVKRV